MRTILSAAIISIFIPILVFSQTPDSVLVDINNLKIPVISDGSLGDCSGRIHGTGKFDGIKIMCSGGFYLSGYHNDSLWVSGQFPSLNGSRHFQSGKVDNGFDLNLYRIYTVKTADEDFGESWQAWKDAVHLGAKFYDGDQDGNYEPVDLNNNGHWDPEEDKPDILGDFTTWCLFNDGIDIRDPNWNDTQPVGIEVRQTVFGFIPETNANLSNVIFVRLEIENMGTASESLDSVIFGIAIDPDIGDYVDDLTGCDSIRNASFAYNNGEDDLYGSNPPALLIDMLQGPQAYINGITYLDLDSNNVFEEGVDTPLIEAGIMNGPLLGSSTLNGAVNLNSTAIYNTRRGRTIDSKEIARNFMIGGIDYYGQPIDVCEYYPGNGPDLENCSEINPEFMFSGNPLAGEGWLDSNLSDRYILHSSGQFKLEIGKPVDIKYAIIAGRGVNNLNSLEIALGIDDYVQDFYENNFALTTEIKNLREEFNQINFTLSQNYPNPFNPATTIEYSLPTVGPMASLANAGKDVDRQSGDWRYNVSLKIYDILGREVATLVDTPQPPGNYKVIFDMSEIVNDGRVLASGIYYYTIRSGNFIQTKKMIYLK